MAKLKVSSGADVVINIADFEDADEVSILIQQELSKGSLNLAGIKKEDLAGGIGGLDLSVVEPLIKSFLAVSGSREVRDAIFKCLSRCLYNGEKITKETFNPAEARADYYEIVFECLKVNLSPFFTGLASKFGILELLTENLNSQKSE